MAIQLRPTGIEELGDQPWGTHFCLFYEAKEDLLDLLTPYIKAGLENDEFCLYIASKPVLADEAERALREAVPQFEQCLAAGQIEIITHHDWYLAGGRFDPIRVRQGWIDKLNEGLARGYAGMRLVSSAFWLEKQDWVSFAEYEGKLDEVFGQLRILAVCAYALARCSAADMLDVVRHHQFTVIRRRRSWERLDGPELKRAYDEIRRLNSKLEQRVQERTARLGTANAQLEKSERVLREAETLGHTGSWEQDLVTGEIFNTEENLRLFFGDDRSKGGPFEDYAQAVHPDDREYVLRRHGQLLAEGGPSDIEYRVVWPDGSVHVIFGRATLVRDELGRAIRTYGTNVDVTERKRAEDELRASEAKFRALCENAPVGIVIFQGNAFRYVNPAMEVITGYSQRELMQMNFWNVGHPEERERLRERGLARQRGEPVPLRVEFKIVTKSGEERWLEFTDGVFELEGKLAIIGMVFDITERKRAEEALRESEERFAAAFRASPVGVVIVTLEGKCVEVNQAFCDLLGYSREEMIGKTAVDLEILTPEGRQQWVEALARGGGTISNVELPFRSQEGITRSTLSSVETITLHGVPHQLATSLDITERKQAEAALREHSARAHLLAEVSRAFSEAGLDYEVVLQTAARCTAELIGDACVMTLFSEDRQRSYPVAFHHPDPQTLVLMREALMHTWQGGTDTQRYSALLAGQAVCIPVVNPDEFRASLEPEFWPFLEAVGISSVLIVPMRTHGQVIGTLGLTRDQPGRPYSPDDQALLQEVADRAALTIQNARLFQSVDEHRQRLRALSARLVEAQEGERRRLARELHDEVGQILTGLQVTLNVTGRRVPEAAQAGLAEAQNQVGQLMDRMHDLAFDLRPAMLDDLGLVPALLWQFERYTKQTGIRVQFEHRVADRRFDTGVETAAYRIIQEALTNVARHAGAPEATVHVGVDDGRLSVQIDDAGAGFDVSAALAAPASSGLSGMRERVELLGGELTIESAPGAGTQVTAEIPLRGSLETRADEADDPAGG
jgi:PAS domain S-box-containing protein